MSTKLWIIVLIILLQGCSSSYQSINQVDSSAYLQLEGKFIGTSLIIDKNEPITLTEAKIKTFSINDKTVARFPITIGKHRIIILRDQKVIVDRLIYVSNSNTFEVVVP